MKFIDYASCNMHTIVLVDRAILYRPQQTRACPRGRGLIVGNSQYRHRIRLVSYTKLC